MDGERAYLDGEVVLPDGRLLVLIGGWSDDRRHRPGGRHHGLWISDGDDWSSYRPYEPRFRPALAPPPGGLLASWSSLTSLHASPAAELLWVRTADDRVYVSLDAARTFREVAAR